MSDNNQISVNNIEEQQETISSLNDDPKSISISNVKSSMQVDQIQELENDSDYEDLEDDEIDEATILTSMLDRDLLKETIDDDKLDCHIKPRLRRAEHSKSQEDEDDLQRVPKPIGETKLPTKGKESLDDDNNTQSPAYIPRKGKFYEHDDRTSDGNDRTKQEISANRLSKDFEGKWQHDLYFEGERSFNSRYSTSQQDHRQSKPVNQNRFPLNDYMFRSAPIHTEHRERVGNIPEKNFSLNRHSPNLRKKPQSTSDHEQRNVHPNAIDERIFHRRRNFTNSQYQQDESTMKFYGNSSKRNISREMNRPSQEINQFRDNDDHRKSSKYEVSQKTRNLPLRFPDNASNVEHSKRYSHMRNNLTNPSQVQTISSSQIKHSQDQQLNMLKPNDWPQAPSLPTSYLPKQLITPQMYYQQTTSRYVTLNNPTASVSEQV